ncbi:MAG: HAMP domain-containing protein [Proteobacteria bacterium]|nr:HAMP domain-containing protein [Pseudomonadota bacterium]
MRQRRYRFRTRVLAFLVGLVLGVQGAALVAVYVGTTWYARDQVEQRLGDSAAVFAAVVKRQEQQLAQSARLVTGDFGFKSAFGIRHERTMVSALGNMATRIGADSGFVTDLDGKLVAGTAPTDSIDERAVRRLIELAESRPDITATDIDVIAGRAFQTVAAPLMAPVPVAWVLLGFELDDAFARELKVLAAAEVTLGAVVDGDWVTFASTIATEQRVDFNPAAIESFAAPGGSRMLTANGRTLVTLARPVNGGGIVPVTVVLQNSLDDALAPFQPLRIALAALLGLGLAVSLTGAWLIGRSVTAPVERLAAAVGRAADGDYGARVETRRNDEFGALADSFNHMLDGLKERDQARDLLGKVVSPQIAGELIRSGVELGGEEREASVLFADMRGFTAIVESMPPAELVAMLNEYFSRLTEAIESCCGVIDKYIGDAIMAVFGAPVRHGNHAGQAVSAALRIGQAVTEMNVTRTRQGLAKLGCGVGINTGTLVAGNMGSRRRMNYTVVGDGVNIAARLEGLTRAYDVAALVTEATRDAAPAMLYRELDRVRVKGRAEPIRIFEPLGRAGQLPPETIDRIARWEEALGHYRARNWAAADAILAELMRGEPESTLYALFRARIVTLQRSPPGAAWDGTFVFAEK